MAGKEFLLLTALPKSPKWRHRYHYHARSFFHLHDKPGLGKALTQEINGDGRFL